MGYQFKAFQCMYKINSYTDDDINVMEDMLKLIQQLCEGHNPELQKFLGEDYTFEETNIFTAKALAGDDDDDEGKDLDDDEDKDATGDPNNIAQWVSEMTQIILANMQDTQKWQASMEGRSRMFQLLNQMFVTASELIQGPNRMNQA